MPTIFIDNRPYEAPDGSNLLEACLSLGFDIPYFCWHPALGTAGACRQCAVKKFANEKDTKGRIVMSCQEPVVDGLRLSIDDPEARAFRASVIGWLMASHPHDCPVCDEGGECHLQDMTVMTGHVYREYRFKKRTHRSQDLGPFVAHEMNRCIQCYRCVRFYRDYAGGRDFSEFALSNRLFYGRHKDGPLESPFSGNLVEVCPTGVFTDKTLSRHYTRKWDLATAPSVCVHCGLGCNTIPGERYGTLRRILNRYNGEVNGYFLCDRGRFGYEFVNGAGRIREARLKGQGSTDGDHSSRDLLAGLVRTALEGPSRAIGIGSPRASLEANFALRELVGPDRFYAGVADNEGRLTDLALRILCGGPARPASLADASMADAVVVLGEDLTNTAPLLDLALRQAARRRPSEAAVKAGIPLWHDIAVREFVQEAKGPVFVAAARRTALGAVAEEFVLSPEDTARLGFATARLISGYVMPAGLPPAIRDAAELMAKALDGAARPLVVSGVAGGSAAVLRAAADLARALTKPNRRAGLVLTVPESNSLGLAMLGAGSLQDGVDRVLRGEAESAIVLENDLYRRLPERTAEAFFDGAKSVVLFDHIAHRTAERAGTVIPVGTFAESEGTLVNNEGRAQRFYRVLPASAGIRESWHWLCDLGRAAGRESLAHVYVLDDLIETMVEKIPELAGVLDAAPSAGSRIHGLKVPREPARASGRTAVHAGIAVKENAPPADLDSPLAFSMEGTSLMPPPALLPRFWAPGWNSVQAVAKYQTRTGGPLRGGDPGRRLIEPTATSSSGPTGDGPRTEGRAPEGSLVVVPVHHLFGSDETSALAPGIASRVPAAVLLFNDEDAAELGVREGAEVGLEVGGETITLPANLTPDICRGAVGLPRLGRGVGIDLPAYGKIKAVRTP
ncbi:MAG TPA: NADH-quinone oxidoreductase subunit NuoG [Candidatus Bathyarchaeia archaeon]|nr:NADH-quinone oxidoreductase subunit NuoG [Candidatus Bathyarchaeia archaeon]